MNYYPFHLGDYAAHTGHLEPMEDLAYRRLLDQYYLREGPLPADTETTAKLVRMRSMKADVESVLNEFFTLTDAGWTHGRCTQEIERMQDKQAKARVSAQASVSARKAKSMNVRSTDVQEARDERLTNAQKNQTDVKLPTPTPTPTPITNTHTPPPPSREIASTREPQGACFETSNQAVLEKPEPSPEPPPPPPEKPVLPSMAGAICVALKSQGIFDVNPSHPTLRALVDAGVGVDVFVQAAQAAVGKSKGFAYVLGIVKGQMAEAVKMAEAASAQAALAIKSASNNRQHERLSFRERDRELARDRYEEIFGKPHPDRVAKQERTIIDITPTATFLGVEK